MGIDGICGAAGLVDERETLARVSMHAVLRTVPFTGLLVFLSMDNRDIAYYGRWC